MADLAPALTVVLAHEGGLVDHPADPGGLTNRGITWGTYRDWRGPHATPDELRHLSLEDATAIYRALFWDRYGYSRVIDQGVATKLFDMSVNLGPSSAHRLAQAACAALGERIVPDGVLGPRSIDALNACPPRRLLLEMCGQQAEHYRRIAEARPASKVFLAGWTKRAAWIPEASA